MRLAFAKRVKWLGPLAGVAALSIGLGLGAVALGAGSGGSTASQTTAPILIMPRSIATFDERGHRYQPTMRSQSGGPVPPRVRPGRSVTLRLDTVLPTGSGEVVWTGNGTTPIVSYEFVTEID